MGARPPRRALAVGTRTVTQGYATIACMRSRFGGQLFDSPDPKWPSPDDELFKEDEDWWNTAIVGQSGGVSLIADGFLQAGDLLVEHVASTQMDQDSLVYPIMFSYRHYLELKLKTVIVDARSLLGHCGAYPTGHNLWKLWRECRPMLDEIFPESNEPHDVVEANIKAFMKVDPTSTAYRYDVGKDGKPIETQKDRVPLANVAHVMEGLGNLFSGTIDAIDAYRDAQPSMDDYV